MTADPTTSPPVDTSLPLRVGVLRASGASLDPTLATMEARVVRAELERRLGPVTLDLRTHGAPVGPWLPGEHAAWPADVDATFDLGLLGDHAVGLLALFGRTVEPTAAEVRSRMLHHLDVLPVDGPLTEELLDELLPPPARPTDLWLVVRAASSVSTGEPAHEVIRNTDGALVDAVDRRLDEMVDSLPSETTAAPIRHLRAELADLRTRLAEVTDELVRSEREAVDRIHDLTAERDSLRERLERSQLDRAGAEGSA